jgi:hypothetical protein
MFHTTTPASSHISRLTASSKDSAGSIKPASAEKNRPGNFFFGGHYFSVIISSKNEQFAHFYQGESSRQIGQWQP